MLNPTDGWSVNPFWPAGASMNIAGSVGHPERVNPLEVSQGCEKSNDTSTGTAVRPATRVAAPGSAELNAVTAADSSPAAIFTAARSASLVTLNRSVVV